ncbi:MAG: hypothetical protein DHS20C19_08520 [Acidimicrobiales bacterium]|nr:MAG: hypothetical protein DHS20C19_08520 [Acidimicrobiales bacterium]
MNFARRLSTRFRGDRGASGVEYALLLTLMFAGSTTTFEMMDDNVGEHYEESAHDIGRTSLEDFDVTTTTCADCETTTTTTEAPTTTAAPTTTTTTTLPPTTTTTAAPDFQAEVTYDDLSFEMRRGWKAKIRVGFVDEHGDPLKGARAVVTMTTADGDTKEWEFNLGRTGEKTLAWGNRPVDQFPIVVRVESITFDDEELTPDRESYTLRAR